MEQTKSIKESLKEIDPDKVSKCCSICGQTKKLTEFAKDISQAFGYKTICRSCARNKNKSYETNYTWEEMQQSMVEGKHLPGKSFILIGIAEDVKGGKSFKILCDCGRERNYNKTSINRSSSCGHEECNYNTAIVSAENSIIKETDRSGFFIKNGIWNDYKRSAEARGIEFHLTPEDVLEIWEEQKGLCNKTGHKLTAGSRKKLDTHTWSINRIDSKREYVRGNVELVHKFCNQLQNKYSNEVLDTFSMARALWILQNDKEYADRLKEMLKSDREDSNVLDEVWRMGLKQKGESKLKGKPKKNNFMFEENEDIEDTQQLLECQE